MVSFIGISIICIVSVLLLGLYRAELDRTVGEYADLIALLDFICSKISHSSMKLKEIFSLDIELKHLVKYNFLSNIRRFGISEAYEKIRDQLAIENEDKKLLDVYFSDMGCDLYHIEIKKLTSLIEKLKEKLNILMISKPQKKKVISRNINNGY